MSKKSKVVVFDSKTPYRIGMHEDAKARLKYQTLMQDYEELQKEADVMRSKLDSSKQRKLMLAAEVRFLRRRYKYLVLTKNTNPSRELSPVKASLKKQAKITKEKLLMGKGGSQHRLPLIPEVNSKKKQVPLPESFPIIDQPQKKKSYKGKEAKGHGLSLIYPRVSDLNCKAIMHMRKEVAVQNTNPILDRNPKERVCGANDATLCHPTVAFDLNQVTTSLIEKETLPTRAPIFDLNEISTEDEEFQGKVEEAGKSLIRGINEEQQNDMKLSICRNAGESTSRGGERKISWQDPVALRV